MKQATVYLAGPYTKPDPVANTREAILLGAKIRDTFNCRVFVPHFTLFEHILEPKPYEHWLKIDLDWLPLCDVMYRFPGESSGADKEEVAAKARHIPIVRTMEEMARWHSEYAGIQEAIERQHRRDFEAYPAGNL